MDEEARAIAERIDVAMRRKPADVVIRQVRLFDLATGELRQVDIALKGKTIIAVGEGYEGKEEIDGRGLTAVPGFVDMHCHIESSMVTPYEWERVALAHGTTMASCDPHELTNVAGGEAIDYFEDCADRMVMRLNVCAPSCVPALPTERSGAKLDAEALMTYTMDGLPLAEMMNVPGVINKDPDVLEKLAIFYENGIDGHAPLVTGDALQALCVAGIHNDHETSTVEEALEKLRAGMALYLRYGTMARDLPRLTSLVNLTLCGRLGFCSDDRSPEDLMEDGHIDAAIRLAIQAGCDPLAVYRVACQTAIGTFAYQKRGLIAPGYRADIVLLSNLETCTVDTVICGGKRVTKALFAARDKAPHYAAFKNSVHCPKMTAEAFMIPSEAAPIIGVQEGNILTEALEPQAVPRETCNLAALIARHDTSGDIGTAWVHGFNLKRGAIASTVGHDSHNLCVVGATPEDMAVAVNALRECGGGYAVVVDGEVKALLPLPIGGLMSDKSVEVVAEQHRALTVAAQATETTLSTPFMSLAFLPLPVIPHARLTLEGAIRV